MNDDIVKIISIDWGVPVDRLLGVSVVFSPEEFKRMYQCDFARSDRELNLYNRVSAYFCETENMNNRDATRRKRALRKWAECNGYSTKDVSEAIKMFQLRGVR